MAYARENDELRQELRQSVAKTVSFWPKIDGKNVAITSATFTVKDPAGTTLQSGSATANDVNGVDRVDCAVNAISTLDEDYTLHIAWIYSGVTYLHVIQFDVVLWPFGEPSVSLNDILEVRADAEDILERIGQRLGYSTDHANEAAGVMAYNARVELEEYLSDRIDQDARTQNQERTTGVKGVKLWRPNAILNRERLNRAERMLAVKIMYESDMGAPDSGDESAALYEHFREKSDRALRSIGPIKFDLNEDLLTDHIEEDLGRSIRRSRRQA